MKTYTATDISKFAGIDKASMAQWLRSRKEFLSSLGEHVIQEEGKRTKYDAYAVREILEKRKNTVPLEILEQLYVETDKLDELKQKVAELEAKNAELEEQLADALLDYTTLYEAVNTLLSKDSKVKVSKLRKKLDKMLAVVEPEDDTQDQHAD